MARVKGESRLASPGAERVGVLVLGMHRSGTSALARVLSLLGCDLPKTLVEATSSNEAGHWESLPIDRFNDRILDSAGSSWWDWMPFNPGWYSSPKASEFKDEALSLLNDEFGGSRLFVLKDPRICRFAPFWIDALKTAGIRPAVIMQIRNPLEVADSLSRRDGFPVALGELLWLRNVLEAEAATRAIPRYCTSYDALLSGWQRIATASQEALKLSWPRLSLRSGAEIDAFLSGQLRHHKREAASLLDNPLLSHWLRDTFATLNRWAESGEASDDLSILDRIRAELDAAAPAFSQLVSLGKYSADKAKTLETKLQLIQHKLDAAESALEAKQELIASLEQERVKAAEAIDRLAKAEAELATLRAETQSHRNALDEARGQLSHVRSELAQRHAEADDATRQLREVEQRLSAEIDAERQRRAAEEAEQQQRHAQELLAERERYAAEIHAEQGRHVEELLGERERHAAELRTEQERHAGELLGERERHRKELTDYRSRTDREIEELRRLKSDADARISERFSETAALTRMLSERERQARLSDEKAARLRAVSTVMLNGTASRSLKGRLAALVPAAIRLRKQMARLRRARIFDAEAYLAANPDVAEAGVDPLWHYLNHGIDEGRQLQPAPAEHAEAGQ